MGSSSKPGRKEPAAGRKKTSGGVRKGSTSKGGRKASGKRGGTKASSLRGKLPSLPLLAVWIAAVAILGALIYFSGPGGGRVAKKLIAGRNTEHRAPVEKAVREPVKDAAAGSRNLASQAPPAVPPHANGVQSRQKSSEPELPAGPVLAPRPAFSSKDLPSETSPATALLALNRPAPTPPPPLPAPPTEPVLARVAIVIDDLGPDIQVAKKFLSLPFPVTLSILPHQSHTADIAALAHSRGRGVMLHLPMEPQGYPRTNPGRGALLLSMSGEAIKNAISSALNTSPYFQGVNNHMGSRMTENAESMKLVLGELNRRGLFFLDSFTSPRSKGLSVARELHMPSARRNVFLDNSLSADSIDSQLERLIEMARLKGSAIAIGHPHEATFKALLEAAPRFAKNGIKIVPVSELMSGGDRTAASMPQHERSGNH